MQSKQNSEQSILTWSFFSLLLGVLFLSAAAILIRLSEDKIGISATLFNRLWIATIFLGFWHKIIGLIQRSPSQENPQSEHKIIDHFGLLFLVVIIDLICILFWAWSLTQTTIANSNLLHNLTPIFVTLGGWLFLNQSFSPQFVAGVVLASIGSGAIAFSDFQFGSQYIIGDSVALSSAILYGICYLIYENLRQKFSATTLMFWTCLIQSILLFPFALFTDSQIFPSSWSEWLIVICLGVFCQGLGHLILLHSFKEFSAGFVSLLLLLDPVLTAIFAGIILAEKLSYLNWIAFGIVLLGIYLAKSSQNEKTTASKQLHLEQDF